jgi:hypothetical protein
MAKRLVEYDLEGGGSILVEVDVEDLYAADDLVPAASPGELAAKAGQTFEQALSTVKRVAESVVRQIEELPRKPDEVGVEFGLKLAGGVNAVLASASGEANVSVTLTWKGDGARAS